MRMIMKKISQILSSIYSYEIDFAIYLPKSEKWSLNTEGDVLDPDEAEDPDGNAHDFVNLNGLSYIFDISLVDQIRQNIIQQTDVEPSVEDLFSGFIYYYEHDAFKRW